ncbi:DNA cytosine methyltransferase [Paenibacillus apiarius]|uniref:DNA cytosine methyltransferase n=1 Tax=Paenibacillus apiarius TaxID=46240 RepID=UPI003B3B207B
MRMRKLSLFSGIGGIDLAAEWAGMRTVAFCEREPFPQKVLRKHWPDTPIYDDVCTLTKERLEQDGIIGPGRTIDIISAGYPCQPFSNAGKRRGKEDDRHLWPEVARLLSEIRPRWFLGENVAGHITLGLDDVLADLESIGYGGQTFVVPSAAVGAPHRRDRVFILGYTECVGFSGESRRRAGEEPSDGYFELEKRDVAYSEGDLEGRLSLGTRTENTRPACSREDVANTSVEGLPQRRRSRITTTGTEAESGMESESERCSETMADASIERIGGLSIFSRGQEQTCTDTIGCGQDVADSGSTRFKERDPSTKSARKGYSTGGVAPGRSTGSIESGLGGMLDGLSDWLDGYRWPAAQGQEQYDWEPPRVATGVKDRVGRLKALGNAVNPVQVYPILAAIKAIDDHIMGATAP